MQEKKNLDIVCFDVTLGNSVAVLEKLRSENEKAYIIVIASMEISPVEYMKPTIMAASLLLRPLQEGRINDTVSMIIELLMAREQTDQELFVLEDRDGKIRIPYRKIQFFESRDKKIYVCTETEQYGFYDTLENLSVELPEYFVRCHRGFIVNMKLVKKVVYSENSIFLLNGYQVPLSRTYKGVVRRFSG